MAREDSLVGLFLCDMSPLIRLQTIKTERSCGMTERPGIMGGLRSVYCISEAVIMRLVGRN